MPGNKRALSETNVVALVVCAVQELQAAGAGEFAIQNR